MKKRLISLLLSMTMVLCMAAQSSIACRAVAATIELQDLAQVTTNSTHQIVMTADEFIDCLKIAESRPNTYNNKYPYNLGYYDGSKISWDCWNLGKSIIWSKGSIVNNYTSGTHAKVDTSCGLGDWDGLKIIKLAPNCDSDFSNLIPGEWLYMDGHTGYYVGNGQVIECTKGWGVNGITYSQIDSSGNRSRNGVSNGKWLYHGMVPWIEYNPDLTEYLSHCTEYPCGVVLEIRDDCSPYTLPCNNTTATEYDCTSTKLDDKKLYSGDTVTATALYKNTQGNYWYKVTLPDDTVAFLYSTHTEMADVITPWLEGDSFPSSISGSTSIRGTLRTYGVLNAVQAFVYKGNTIHGTPVIESDNVSVGKNTYTLLNSEVDLSLKFQSLQDHGSGNYTLTYFLDFSTYYADGNELSTSGLCTNVGKYAFYFDAGQSSGGDTEISTGVQNIVKRARQMTSIRWTPQADIIGWNSGVTYKKGVTYTGLPYGQPVYTSYVPWTTSLEDFIAAVNDSGSKMYTSYSSYNKRAPYYSIDCSAFVSWAWGLSSRQTTSTIKNFATQISTTSYENAQIGDCLCKAGSHVVLITDISYDSNGKIDGIEISESTVNAATYYCCQVTWYGKNGTKTLSQLKSKYFDNGYILYRSKTRDSVTYTHSCVVPLPGDNCSKCQTHAHSYSSHVSEQPTCVEAGTRVYACECGHTYSESIPAKGHTYGPWATVTAATCENEGVQKCVCSACGEVQTQSIAAVGHSYQTTVVEATCVEYGYICYNCVNCGDTFTEAAAYSPWSTTKPIGVDESRIESRVEYRCSDYEIFTSYDPNLLGYELLSSIWQETESDVVEYVATWPAGFSTGHALYSQYNNTPQTCFETETDKVVENQTTTAGYIYWHWCRGSYEYGPINRKISTKYTSEFKAFHAFFSTTKPDTLNTDSSGSCYEYANGACCKDTHWYYALEVTAQSYTSYRKVCTYGGWSDWSDWGVGEYAPSDTRKVESRTVYRYAMGDLADHVYETHYDAPTCTKPGSVTYTCANCGDSYTETIAATGHSYENGRCVHCGEAEPVSAVYGDVNGDGWADVEDAMMILQYEVGLLDETELELTVGDVSGDGWVDVEDAMLILQYEVGLVEKFPVEATSANATAPGVCPAAFAIPKILTP